MAPNYYCLVDGNKYQISILGKCVAYFRNQASEDSEELIKIREKFKSEMLD
jgi:hypothetical protein